MNQSISIVEDQYNHILTFRFLNGEISIREDEYGGYAFCPGCGAGKTTVVKELIKLRWYEGILYAAFTKDELNEMYQFIVNNLVGKAYDSITGEVLTINDIIVLHSDYTSAGTNNNLWRNRPEDIANKKIVLCTHAKLLTEPLHLLITANFNSGKSYFPPVYSAIRGIGGINPRKWILIDETADASNFTVTINKTALGVLGEFSNRELRYNPETCRFETYILPDYILNRRNTFYPEFVEKLDVAIDKLKDFKKIFKKEDTELNKIRNNRLKENLYLNYQLYANTNNDNCRISLSFTDLLTGGSAGIASHVILLDGTADLTLYNSKKFKLVGFNDRYNSSVNLSIFPFGVNRRLKVDRSIPDIDFYVKDKFTIPISYLESIIRQNQKTLIFCWKNMKPTEEYNDDMDDDKLVDSGSIASNKKFTIPDYITKELESKGLKLGENFSIEYYGSGKDKAINEYREYDGVVLLGKYTVPDHVITDFNIMYDSNITSIDYYTNRVIQAICRTRIRLHQGLPINVYMSSDWSSDVINKVKIYLGVQYIGSEMIKNNQLQDQLDYRYNKLLNKGITPKKAEQIAKISFLDDQIFNCIITNTTYRTQLKLTEIYQILPRSERKASKYNAVLLSMRKYGIDVSLI